MKVLLINPPGTEFLSSANQQPPLGFLYLAGELERNGHEVDFIDGCIFGKKAVIAGLEKKPDVVGIQCLSPRRHKAFEMVALTKELSPDSRVVMGGPHPTAMAEQVLDNYPVDAVCQGEGERWLNTYVETNEEKHDSYENLDDLPEPAWDKLRFEDYMAHVPHKQGLKAHVGFSRGCTYHCTFCAVWSAWKTYRNRSPRNMLEEMKYLHEKRNVGSFYFVDDILTANYEPAMQLFEEIIRSGLKINWNCATRVDCVDLKMLKMMKKSGCRQISYGVESGSVKMLNSIHKGSSKAKSLTSEEYLAVAEETLIQTQECGINVCALMMIGNPGETGETISDSLKFLKKTRPVLLGVFGGVWIIPGTALYQKGKREGIIDDSFWLKSKQMRIWPFPLYKLRWWKFRLSSYRIEWLIKHIVASYFIPRQILGRWRRKVFLFVTRNAQREISFHNEEI